MTLIFQIGVDMIMYINNINLNNTYIYIYDMQKIINTYM